MLFCFVFFCVCVWLWLCFLFLGCGLKIQEMRHPLLLMGHVLISVKTQREGHGVVFVKQGTTEICPFGSFCCFFFMSNLLHHVLLIVIGCFCRPNPIAFIFSTYIYAVHPPFTLRSTNKVSSFVSEILYMRCVKAHFVTLGQFSLN